ncbi:hypothetical protein V8E54_000679, partial [Elaphomyces granulatus]
MYLAFCHAGSSRSQRSVLFFLESYTSLSATLFVSPSLGLAHARRDPLSLTVLIARFCSEWPDIRRYGSTTRCPATVCMYLTLVTEACLQDQMRRRILLSRSPKSLIRYVRSTENPVTAQDTMPTLQPLHEGEEHSVTVEEQISRTSCSEDVSDPELLLAHRQLQELRCQRKKAEIQALIEREKRLIAQAQKDAVSATLIESNQGPVVPQPLQEAIAATPTGRIKAHEVQPPALQDAVSATPTRSIQAMKCKCKLYKTQFLPLLLG